jgi:hypothetical protein
LWTAEYNPERPQRSEAPNITAPPAPFALADEVNE